MGVLAREMERLIHGHYLVCSQRMVRAIEDSGVRLQGRVELLPNWIRGERPPHRTAYYDGSGPLRILFAGQIGRHKGVDILIRAAGRLLEQGLNSFTVDLYGKVADPSLQTLIHELGLGDCVHLRGSRTQNELWNLYEDYDVFAYPTWEREPFAFAPLEAAARGCLPVLSRICGNSEWFVDGVHCLKADRTPEAFSEALRAILRGQVDLPGIVDRASAVVWRDFHLDTILPRIESMFQLAARQPRAPAGSYQEAYRLALLAEKLTQVLIQEPSCA